MKANEVRLGNGVCEGTTPEQGLGQCNCHDPTMATHDEVLVMSVIATTAYVIQSVVGCNVIMSLIHG